MTDDATPATTTEDKHTWQNRERMAWYCLATLILTTTLPFLTSSDLTERQYNLVSNGQLALACVVMGFILGKGAVEVFTTLKLR